MQYVFQILVERVKEATYTMEQVKKLCFIYGSKYVQSSALCTLHFLSHLSNKTDLTVSTIIILILLKKTDKLKQSVTKKC